MFDMTPQSFRRRVMILTILMFAAMC